MQPLKVLNNEQTFGIQLKPKTCQILCPYFSIGSGYLEDTLPPEAKIMVMLASPSSEDLLYRKFLSGKAGFSFFKNYIYPLGYRQEHVAICGVMRCRPVGGKFPLGQDKKGTVEACRYYDQQKVKDFGPKSYIISQSLKDVYQENAFHSLMVNDFKKAFRFAEKGLRPIVLMGNEASEIVAPYIVGQGGTKKWRGEWREIEVWPFLTNKTMEPQKPTFASGKLTNWKR